MIDENDRPEVLYFMLPDVPLTASGSKMDPDETMSKLIIPQMFMASGLAPVQLSHTKMATKIIQRVKKQAVLMGLQVTLVSRKKCLFKFEGIAPNGESFSSTAYVRPLWMNPGKDNYPA